MSDLFLGIIAGAVLVMAVIQVAAIVFALRAARRAGEAMTRFEQDVRPIVTSLQTIAADAARATGVAAAQVQRAEHVISDLAKRVEETAAAVQSSIVGPAREALALLRALLAALGSFRTGATGSPASRKRPAPSEEEDPLFIG